MHVPFQPHARYPDPALQILDPAFLPLRLYSSTLEQVASGLRWAEGPVYFPGQQGGPGHLLVSDIPGNRILRFDETDGRFSVFRSPSNHANGHTRDRQGRLVSCEHSVTRRITRTEHDGTVTVLATGWQGQRFNAPNDIVVKSDGSIWFTDPLFGIQGWWEGEPATPELPGTWVFRLDPDSGEVTPVITDLGNPNGLAFSPDERYLYVVECRPSPWRSIWRYALSADGRTLDLAGAVRVVQATDHGALDGLRVDEQGNLWCGWGASSELADAPVTLNGRQVWLPAARSEDLDGVRVFSPEGRALAHLSLPERCANLCWGGPKGNRLYMAASHSVYAMHFNTRGAGWPDRA
ncbi:SMP-30/gluconolactonase/LRE family protein [Ideonella livida]|uniref:SMP-30/gluconolactonase/LRE family protein n=1 Tax=Ideonella livida TaxID=2707176 RepID=A0A7C9THA1_9BURK|nr:SMP-30/gluconolactonase/LRE family protein [Ideonella livida]NDY90439.1 SMP-30/gluconolactonase/LRE family protein [Ideonella livida]